MKTHRNAAQIGLAAVASGVYLFAFVAASEAATITVIPAAGATYDATTGALQANGFSYDGLPHIYRVDLFTSVAGAIGPQTFGAVSYDVALTGGVSRNALQLAGDGLTTVKDRYSPNNPAMANIVDGDGNPIPKLFSGGINFDLGTSLTDLVAVTAAIDPSNLGSAFDAITRAPVPDPRIDIGRSSPFLLGTVYVVGGVIPGHFITHNGQYAVSYVGGGGPLGLSPPLADGDLLILPEPATIWLMVVGCCGLIGLGTSIAATA